jgi:signal transduction histidine kinase
VGGVRGSPDGREVLFSSDRLSRQYDLFRRSADPGGQDTLFSSAPGSKFAEGWSEDGGTIAIVHGDEGARRVAFVRGNWDADRLAQVLSNLVANAIQHGGGTPVRVSANEQGDGVSLTVHNGGAPIPAELMPTIFEPLARGINQGDMHNIGLGLFIAQALVRAHGGEISVKSSTDDGTTFTAWLPKFESGAPPAV